MDLTTILNELMNKFSLATERLEPIALGILTLMFGFELLVAIAWRQEESDPVKILRNKFGMWAGLYTMIFMYRRLLVKINESFIWLAGKASGVEIKNPSGMPSAIIGNGFLELEKLRKNIQFSDMSSWLFLVLLIFGIVIVCYLALEIFIVYLEYSLITSLVIIFIPFCMFEKTRFMGERVFSLVISQNIKIFLLTFLISFITKYLNEPLVENTLGGGLMYIAGLAGLAFLASKTSGLSASIIQGTPQLSSGLDVKSFTAGAIAGAVGAGTIVKQAGIGASAGASQGGISGYAKNGYAGGVVGTVTGAIGGGISGAIKGAKNLKNNR
ncbi:putative P-type conjugative transfer protein TrbL [Cetobacterium somerae ATCC BAA-474]|uniref:Putative P-type conjugative transfer protein TrbL n=1 Tax=Cetobacterium somerae ATCC BAA-474 TaxID=1319815 RepID=U7V5N1_9FUSO|nr:type IV secretion system protein [Cetobacterium somerae]ERT66845.1 putative P-type conjugative transfer protein TrbL [Cetobacterium somerae ATCC BAA-474]